MMADDDDDDSFGEFTFASNRTMDNSSFHDWGDFNFIQNTTDHNLKSPQPQPQPQTQTQPKWVKIKGALPLSVFGDEEEEEEDKDEKSIMPVAGDDVKQSSFHVNSGFVFDKNNNNDKSNAHLGINDLMAILYGPRQQQLTMKAADNGNEVDFTATNSTVSKDPLSKWDSMSSFSSNTVAASGNHGSDDEGGWEFIDAFSDSKLAQNGKDNNVLSEKTVFPVGVQDVSHGPIDLFAAPKNRVFAESDVTDNGFDSKPTTNVQNGSTADLKAASRSTPNELSSNSLRWSVDTDDAFGEFETAFMDQPSKKKELSPESNYPLGSHDASQGSVDLFSLPNGLPGSHYENNGVDFKQNSVLQNGVASDSFFQTEWKDAKDDSDSQPPGGDVDDENFGKFETTFPEAESKPEGSEASSKNYRESVPLSIFGIEEEPQTDSYMNLQHEFFKSSTHGKNMQNQSSSLSINDILSDLYSQAKPISSPYLGHNPDGEDASSQSRPENQNLSLKKRLNNCMDFYSSLKDELCLVARRHLHVLKKAQSTATLAGEEMKVEALNKEIQEVFEELHQKDILSTEIHSDDHLEPVISLKQYIETLHEPDFQILESEYHISRRLSLAESDLRTAVDLINHFTTVLKILTLAPKDEPANYVSIWFKVISACSQELKHGTWIWKQSLEKNVHREILSERQGKQFIIALGEIYRVVVIVGAAVKFYKPWLLLSGEDLEGVYGLLEECDSHWSTSGLEEAIPVESLLESIRHIHDLDELAIANEVLNQEESRCWLSLLSPGVVPEMKMVVWNGDKYFVTLANLWANLISPDPPTLSIHVG
ncbi:uncharacterized protein LOC112514790 isoform X2 [Cynara cardunculus var. scolymus]|uniref:uncharacterized protein LOC112514790 isoform X2 n=1 Tax=Cynara cardunculus var. scolymus TaxID=59895 RepID=UPI000D626F68|nr:uncharacterized protein LOC112514790 isoform X2 [Cynara cardunculus var. scolymus]